MIAGEALLDAFINANILFGVAFVLWFLVRAVMCRVGLKYAYGIQLSLLNAVFIAIICAPFLVAGFSALQGSGVAKGVNVNLSDMVVSYYLNGGLKMKASDFEGLILMRDTFILNVMHADGLFARAVIVTFVVGVALGFVRLCYSIFCLWRIVASSYDLRRIGRVRIRLSDRTLVPFSTRGFRNYYVVIPSQMLGQRDELKVSLAHEFQHIRQGDLEWEVLLEVIKPFFFLNPAYHAWKRQVEHLRELSCDSKVMSHGRIDVREYCETLLSVCQQTLRRDRAFLLAVPKVTLVTADRTPVKIGKSLLERRILSVLDARRLRYQKLVFVTAAIPLIAAVAFTSVAIQRPGDWSHDRLMLSTVVNLDRLDEINRLSTFGRIRN
ncbi:M56 family metallopeptidase [uncultured Tateyamaria sp.]|uniref:M56 family metallopeptidase n=1 Tax=uncultured Tateyamaria sp. TaxID=455651 RepID=UPI00260BBE97|nr:M56 family metallopeptidase [uncultured Tateyamaria sp.]